MSKPLKPFTKNYIECMCHSTEHVFKIMTDNHYTKKDYPEMTVEVQLNQYRNIFKRIWVAIKYVFGYQCKYGHWDCTMLAPDEVERLKDICEAHVDLYNKWKNTTKEGWDEIDRKNEEIMQSVLAK